MGWVLFCWVCKWGFITSVSSLQVPLHGTQPSVKETLVRPSKNNPQGRYHIQIAQLSERKKKRERERQKESEVAQSCPTLWDPMDCSLPASSAHGIFQATFQSAMKNFAPETWPFITVKTFAQCLCLSKHEAVYIAWQAFFFQLNKILFH